MSASFFRFLRALPLGLMLLAGAGAGLHARDFAAEQQMQEVMRNLGEGTGVMRPPDNDPTPLTSRPRPSLPAMPKPVPYPVFFPPAPPPLDSRIRETNTTGYDSTERGARTAAPQLAPYVGEVFYPPLAAHLSLGTLPAALVERLLRYKSERNQLRTELRDEFARGQGQEASARQRALEALAQGQAPRLAALEAAADQLRRDLMQTGAGWGDLREWWLARPEASGFSPAETARVVRGAAFYYPNLLPGQRALLREIVIELERAEEATAGDASSVFFSPDSARVLLPDDLPRAAAERFAAYQSAKAQVKKELLDFVVGEDWPGTNLLRGGRVKAFTERQAPALAALEELAESFRRALPALAAPALERTPLPPELAARVARWSQAKRALREDAVAKILPLAHFNSGAYVKFYFGEKGLDIEPQKWGRTSISERDFAALQQQIDTISDAYAAAEDTVAREAMAIEFEIGRVISGELTIQAAFGDAVRAARQNAAAVGYAEYRTAVFEPGLSPAQRRLLFSAAIEHLGLPLPEGEMLPVGR